MRTAEKECKDIEGGRRRKRRKRTLSSDGSESLQRRKLLSIGVESRRTFFSGRAPSLYGKERVSSEERGRKKRANLEIASSKMHRNEVFGDLLRLQRLANDGKSDIPDLGRELREGKVH
jgi:hypothetical protein